MAGKACVAIGLGTALDTCKCMHWHDKEMTNNLHETGVLAFMVLAFMFLAFMA